VDTRLKLGNDARQYALENLAFELNFDKVFRGIEYV
jgi:hypothetical protein